MNTTRNVIQKAYTYGYPIMGMYELLSTQVLNPKTRTTAFHEFSHTAALSTPKTSFIPAPNHDTTYSRAWIDLREEPVIIETPDTNDRYYTIQLLDLYSETITNIGRRVHGTKAQAFALVGPGWVGSIPKHVAIIRCKTSIVLAFLRVLMEPQDQVDEISKIQRGFHITSLSNYRAKRKETPMV